MEHAAERRFFMTKKEKIEIGKKIHDGEMTAKDAADEFGVAGITAWRWSKAYEQNPGQEGKPKVTPSPSKPLGVPAAAASPPEYEAMGKEELIRELMRRDIEVARLKKATR
jgi:transposase-like protein